MLKAEGIIKKYQIPGRKKDLLEALEKAHLPEFCPISSSPMPEKLL